MNADLIVDLIVEDTSVNNKYCCGKMSRLLNQERKVAIEEKKDKCNADRDFQDTPTINVWSFAYLVFSTFNHQIGKLRSNTEMK